MVLTFPNCSVTTSPDVANQAHIAAVGDITDTILITVPHASGAVPHWLRPLMMDEEWLNFAESHHALDRGAAALGRALGERLAATVIEGEYSRIFIDLNRPLDDASAIVAEIERNELAFNRSITAGDLASRRSAHRRFHARVEQTLKVLSQPLYLVDQHSFSRVGPSAAARDVDIGICAPGDDRFARALLANLENRTIPRNMNTQPMPVRDVLNVRLNEPYSADHPGAYIMRRHSMSISGGVVIEVCDELLSSPENVEEIADLLGAALFETTRSFTIGSPFSTAAGGTA